jgi:hypothetical protein
MLGLVVLPNRLFKVLIDGFDEAFGRQPGLVWSNEYGHVLGHLAGFDGCDRDLLKCLCKMLKLFIAIELGTMLEA